MKNVEHVSKACHHVRFRCQKLMINCRRDDLLKRGPDYASRNCCLCRDRFEDSQFNKVPESMKESAGLIWHAVPTLSNIPNPSKAVTTKRKLPCRADAVPTKKRKAPATHAGECDFSLNLNVRCFQFGEEIQECQTLLFPKSFMRNCIKALEQFYQCEHAGLGEIPVEYFYRYYKRKYALKIIFWLPFGKRLLSLLTLARILRVH